MDILFDILLGLSFLSSILTVDVDYFYSSTLRSQNVACGRFRNIICQAKCGFLTSLCIKNECYCLSVTSSYSNDVHSSKSDIAPRVDSAESVKYAIRPALRHHIAHFCPNLNIARSCIKKCMAVGKPAFCGKDHVCYCGHNYVNMEDDEETNVKETYSQFKDMYKKYFGVDTGSASV